MDRSFFQRAGTIYQGQFWLCWVLFCLVVFGSPLSAVQDAPPGTAVAHSSEKTRYVVRPSLIILTNGDYLAGHVWRDSSEEVPQALPTTVFYRSTDQGQTWQPWSELPGHIGGQLFEADGKLYSLGTTDRFGQLVICRSTDGGKTWTDPQSGGLLSSRAGFDAETSPVTKVGGRIYRCVDFRDQGRFQTLVLSASAGDDLLQRSSWQISTPLALAPHSLGGSGDRLMAGSVVPTTDGGLAAEFRVFAHHHDRAAVARLVAGGANGSFGLELQLDPARDFVDLPGGSEAHQVRWDPESSLYWALVTPRNRPFTRFNRLELVSSKDLRTWTRRTVIVQHRDGIWHGLLQVSWQFDGNDLIFVSATAWDGSAAAERPNYLTFHRVSEFRSVDASDSATVLGRAAKQEFTHGDLKITGLAVQTAPLENGSRAYNGYGLQWSRVPDRFQGWGFTRRVAANLSPLQVTATAPTELLIAVPGRQQAIDLSGWRREPELFYYGDGDRNPMYVFSLRLKADQTVTIPQGSWASGIVLIPPEE